MKNKIGIGTANFGSQYGVNKKQIFKVSAKKILNISKKNRINLIDTASEYPGAEEILGDLNISKFKIVTKIKIPNNFLKKDITKIENKFFASLKKLKVKRVYALLIQNCDELLNSNGKYLYDFFLRLKKKGLILKLGFSVYSTKTLSNLNKKFKYDIIQIPINILNQKFLEKNLLKNLKKKNVEIHSRSSFLQGLLLMNENSLPKKFLNYKNILTEFNSFLKKNNYEKLSFLLNFSFNIKYIDYVIIGIDNSNQLKKLILFSKKNNINFKKFNFKFDSKLVDPRLWKEK